MSGVRDHDMELPPAEDPRVVRALAIEIARRHYERARARLTRAEAYLGRALDRVVRAADDVESAADILEAGLVIDAEESARW